MKIKVEYEISEFTEYTLYFFYVKKKLDNEVCYVRDEDKLLEHEALKKYPKNKYEWVLYNGN